MALRVPRLVLHVGLHKTGTTTLQVALWALRKQLRDRGTGVIVHKQLRARPHSFASAARLTADPALAPEYQEEIRQLVKREIGRVEKRSGKPLEQVIVSSEHLVGARMPSEGDDPVFRPRMEGAINELVEALGPDEVHCVLYTRRQDRLVESCYLWEIQKGLTHSVRVQFPYLDRPVLSFANLADRMSSMPAVDSLRVRPFEIISAGATAYFDDLISNLELDEGLDYSELEEDLSANQSYSHNALQLALEINSRMETKAQRLELRRFLKRQFPVGKYPSAVILSEDERHHLLEVYRDDNESLFKTWMPDLPSDAYSSPARTKALGSVLTPISTGKTEA